jgi:hemolysin III
MSTAFAPAESLGEQIANSLTHGTGALLAVAGLVPLALTAAAEGGARRIVGCSVFGVALVLLYATSTLYHALTHARAKQVLRALDHSAIFILIAGTYTPFTLVSLRGAWGWSLFGVVWGLAILGVTLRLVLRRRPTALFMAIYLAMGWCALVALHPLARALTPSGFALLLAGGVAYSAGVAFYLWRRLRFHHAIWHGFVLLGSVLHYFAILLNVAR